MTRLAINIFDQSDRQKEADLRAAASRIHDVEVVEIDAKPDALVTGDSNADLDGKPVLLIDGYPIHYRPWLFPAFPWRFAPDVLAIRESLDRGDLGKPGLMRMHLWAPASRPQWDAEKIAAIDLARWLFGEAREVTHSLSRHVRAEPCLLIHLGFPSGGMAMLDFTNALREGESYRSLCFFGSLGAAYSDDHRDRNLLFGGGAPSASPPHSERAFMQPMLEDFIASVRAGRDSDAATRDYRDALEVLRNAAPNLADHDQG